jgi:hypothetical protein
VETGREELHLFMGGVDEALEIIGGAQVGADRVQVEGPVAMVASVGVCQMSIYHSSPWLFLVKFDTHSQRQA